MAWTAGQGLGSAHALCPCLPHSPACSARSSHASFLVSFQQPHTVLPQGLGPICSLIATLSSIFGACSSRPKCSLLSEVLPELQISNSNTLCCLLPCFEFLGSKNLSLSYCIFNCCLFTVFFPPLECMLHEIRDTVFPVPESAWHIKAVQYSLHTF